MPRSYSIRLVALTLDCDPKWIDNLLSHHSIPGVQRQRRGVDRRVSDDAVIVIEATRMLASELGLPLSRAIAIATEAAALRNASQALVTRSGISVAVPFASIAARLRARLIEAVEGVARVRRGRPRTRRAI